MILDCNELRNWTDLEELIKRRKTLAIELRKRRDRARKTGRRLGSDEEPKEGEASIEYLFDEAVKADESEIHQYLAEDRQKTRTFATVIRPKNNPWLKYPLSELEEAIRKTDDPFVRLFMEVLIYYKKLVGEE
jgi:hypothetical protein